jgi:hypothetical protein
MSIKFMLFTSVIVGERLWTLLCGALALAYSLRFPA